MMKINRVPGEKTNAEVIENYLDHSYFSSYRDLSSYCFDVSVLVSRLSDILASARANRQAFFFNFLIRQAVSTLIRSRFRAFNLFFFK